ncbi:PorT family protein [Bacteroides caecigallinarum]|uniref:outer membrane beta-barrel protein n=1 Tax=Bacteroides caecigallinarum TaxID=1411144 RepID=UPI001959B429|nr:outer membrane beta-barrel protein [Bacteroides caecigallinarum]MBM6863954.1 PorT family protein [Bacteroides caecigallinarum]
MNELKDKWINDIRNRMEDYSEPLPAGLWEKIDSEISAPKVIPLWKRWQSVAAAAVVVIAISTLSVWYWGNDQSIKDANLAGITDIESSENIEPLSKLVEDGVIKTPETNGQIAVNTVVPEKSESVYEEVLPENEVKTFVSFEKLAVDNTEENNEVKKEDKEISEAEENVQSKEKRINMMKADRETLKRNASYVAMAGDKRKSGRNNIELGIMAGNIPYSSSSSFSGMSRLAMVPKSISSVNNSVVSDISDASATYSQMLFSNMDKETYTDVKHHIPVTIGASVKWNINDKWALESGLNYTYLYSELRSGANSYVEDKQKLHYVGIPLKVQRSIWNNSIFSLYASAGGMMEKCVSGSVETVYVDGNTKKNYESEDLSVKPLQFSVLASLGVQANFNKYFSLYLEPGMIYYFDDNTDILTIRKDKPFNFNLQLGLRFNINGN